MPKTKICIGCQKRKPLSEYYRAPENRDGLLRLCKACCAILRRRRYLKDREKVLEQQRVYYATHKEELRVHRRAYGRAYYRRNRKRLLEYAHRHRAAKKALQASG